MDWQASDSTLKCYIDVKISGTTARGSARGKLTSGSLDDRTSGKKMVWNEGGPQTKKRMSGL